MPARPSETDEVIEHEVRVAASPETVFAYFTDPTRMVQWMGDEATLDPRPGGACRIVFQPAQPLVERNEVAMSGEFVEVDPPRRIVFTWGFETEMFATPPQSTAVEISLTPDGEETVVRLVHRRLHPEAVAFHRTGWEHYLPRLATVAEGRDPGPDPWYDDPEPLMRVAPRAAQRGGGGGGGGGTSPSPT
jgi:uncharacterized protein YndB with AHSA1/START domain